jgi:hypothetical protein
MRGKNIMKVLQIIRWAVRAALASLLLPTLCASAKPTPKPQHVFIIVLENEGYHITFGPHSPATYLKKLARDGAFLPNYYAIGHYSLDNYIAMVSGQGPNPTTQSDCQNYVPFLQTDTGAYGQAIGSGCIYQRNVSTIVNQLESKGLAWKGYMEDMGNDPGRESAVCGQPAGYFPDSTQHAEKGDQYAARHNPFVYFYSIVDDWTNCAAHVVNFTALAADLKHVRTTPNYAFIVPNLCHDGHDPPEGQKACVDGERGGLISANAFLHKNVRPILESPAFMQDGLLIITFDEADINDIKYDPSTGKATFKGDASACCHELPAPNITPGANVFEDRDEGPGVVGPGGGRIGAVLLSPFIRPGTQSSAPYNHYSMLRSIEDFFGVGHLGYAGQKGLRSFGTDIFTRPRWLSE